MQQPENREFLNYFNLNISSHGWNQLNTEVPYIDSCVEDGRLAMFVDSFCSQKEVSDMKIIELIFELVRRAHFPNKPSRFTSLFAVKEKSDFRQWPELNNKLRFPKSHILKIHVAEDIQRFDSNLLRGGLSFGSEHGKCYAGYLPIAMFNYAYKYWSGLSSDLPRFEYLIPLPISGDQISEEYC
jgi:hypothetical protein